MKTVEVIVEHAGKNLSAYIEDAPVITVGNDMREIRTTCERRLNCIWKIIPIPVKYCPESLN